MPADDAMATARARIAREAERRTGYLDFTSLEIDALPEEIASLTHLRKLDCLWAKVADLAPLAGLTKLEQLECSSTQVNSLEPLRGLTELRYLGCSVTGISELGPLTGLTKLQRFDCWGAPVTDLQPLAGLTDLQELEIASTQISDLAPLGKLFKLRKLLCANTQVRYLSPLAGLTQLRWIDVGYTHVSDLRPLAGLTRLERLEVPRTDVSDLSPLAPLTNLEWLNCSLCSLSALPPFLLEKQALKLFAFNAYVPELPYGILSQTEIADDCFARVKAHYADLAAKPTNLPDVRLLLLGNGGVGKTQIARWLAGAGFDPDWDSTHGIQIAPHTDPDSIAVRHHLRIWDFGGQDIYHGTHALFLHGPAILMLVWSRDREDLDIYDHGGLAFRNHPLTYWLAVVTHQSSRDNPVLIVQSKCDSKADEERRFPIPQETLDALPHAIELHVSAKTNRGRDALEEALQEAIDWMHHPNRFGTSQIGAGRLRVQRRLEAMRDADMELPREQRRHRWLEQKDFAAICEQEGGVASPDLLLHYLDANGTVFYRRGLFFDRIVLDQGWALKAIYALFDRKSVYTQLKRQNGRFTLSDLGNLVWQDHSDSERRLLLSMMLSCRMCFLHRSFGGGNATDEYIAPDLLSDRHAITPEVAARWEDDRQTESASFTYALLHDGLIRTIMSEIGGMAGINALYWRGGLVTFDLDTKSRLLIEQEMTPSTGAWQGSIQLSTQGGNAKVLLQKAIAVVEMIQTRLGTQPIDTVRTTHPREDSTPIKPGQEKLGPEWYVSYAWADDRTPQGRAREDIVDQLCAAAEAKSHKICRDKNSLRLGDSISRFMHRIGEGDRIFMILSDKYLRSPFCMHELLEIWRTSQQDSAKLLNRIRVYTLDDADIWKPIPRLRYAAYWKQQYDEMETYIRENGGTAILGERDFAAYKRMGDFTRYVGDILYTIADIVQPRSFEDLERYGFNDNPT